MIKNAPTKRHLQAIKVLLKEELLPNLINSLSYRIDDENVQPDDTAVTAELRALYPQLSEEQLDALIDET